MAEAVVEILNIYQLMLNFVKIDDLIGDEKRISKRKPCIREVLDADLSRKILKNLDSYGLLKGAIQDLEPKADWSIYKS